MQGTGFFCKIHQALTPAMIAGQLELVNREGIKEFMRNEQGWQAFWNLIQGAMPCHLSASHPVKRTECAFSKCVNRAAK